MLRVVCRYALEKDFRAFGEALEATRAPEAKVCAVVSPEAGGCTSRISS
jgi:hypothetical protein